MKLLTRANRSHPGPYLLCLLVWLGATAARADLLTPIVSQTSVVSYSTYLNDLLYTHTGNSRGLTGAQHDLARANIYAEFVSFGLDTSLSAFTYNSQTYYNIVAVHRGRVRPNQIYIVGAHYDSANTPGADDNASGVAGVLESARVLSSVDLEATVIFIAFDREEQGLRGSAAYAGSHVADDIRGMVSLDMIAYNPLGTDHDRAWVYGNSSSTAWKTKLGAAVNRYSNGITADIGGAVNQSDHYPFEQRGKQAALLIEKAVWSNPYYHKATDSVDTSGYLDYTYGTNMTRSVVGLVLEEGGLYAPEPGTLALVTVALVGLVWGRRRLQRRTG